jgi:hypothetical protein
MEDSARHNMVVLDNIKLARTRPKRMRRGNVAALD